MKRSISLFLVVIFCFASTLLQFSAVAATDAVKVGMSFDGTAVVNGEMVLRITVGKPTTALAGLEFVLEYPAQFVTPKITANDENGTEMAKLVTKMPKDWEQLCSISQSESRYYFRFAMPEKGSPLSDEGEIVIDLPFTVKAAGVISFNIPSGEIIAVANDDSLLVLSGKGGEFSTVAAGSGQKFAVDLNNNGGAKENGFYYLDVTVTNVGDAEGIIGLEFALGYDPSFFKPYITKNNDCQMDSFIKSSPNRAWEQMCTLYEYDNKYILRFAALHAESTTDCEKLEIGKSIKLSIPFMVVGKEGQSAKFVCDSGSALAVNNKNEKVKGIGDSLTVSIGERTSSIPQWVYKTESGYIFAPDNMKIADFLAPLGEGCYLTYKGEKVTEGIVKTEYVLVKGNESFVTVVKGDVNCNGIVDSMDYVYAKRVYYGTYKVENARFYATAVSNGEKVGSMDYVYIKRHYFGTYDLSK